MIITQKKIMVITKKINCMGYNQKNIEKNNRVIERTDSHSEYSAAIATGYSDLTMHDRPS